MLDIQDVAYTTSHTQIPRHRPSTAQQLLRQSFLQATAPLEANLDVHSAPPFQRRLAETLATLSWWCDLLRLLHHPSAAKPCLPWSCFDSADADISACKLIAEEQVYVPCKLCACLDN